MKNRFSTRVVATYVEEQLHNGNGSDLLVCAGSSSSVMMSSALIAMWCPAIRDIFMAEPGNPPDAVIFPDLSPAGLYPLKEYIYTGKTSAVSELDVLVISGGDYSGHIVAVTNQPGIHNRKSESDTKNNPTFCRGKALRRQNLTLKEHTSTKLKLQPE